MTVQAYPLTWPTGWPRAKSRTSARFGTTDTSGGYRQKRDITMQEAMKRVRYELERLGVNVADDCVVSTNLKLNLSGLPRGDQGEPSDGGVAVYWQAKNQPMRVMAIDRYHRVRDNLTAIAATLEAMRAIERHGGGQILERAFTGFTALPPPSASTPHWTQVLGLPGTATRADIEAAYRAKARAAHPDTGGSEAAMAALNGARDRALQENA